MLKGFFVKKELVSRCFALYTFEYDRSSTEPLFHFLFSYFKKQLNIDFKYLGFYDESYKDVYGKTELVIKKLQKVEWNEVVNITLDDDDIRSNRRKVSVEFNITRPILTTIVIPEEYVFDFGNFVENYYVFFNVIYGFSYMANIYEWPTAYANGDWQHAKNISPISRSSNEILQNWCTNCDRIQTGFLRDVYEENLINKNHLEKEINGRSLRQFIADNNLGVLHQINDFIFFWRLEDNQLGKARDLLYNTAILI